MRCVVKALEANKLFSAIHVVENVLEKSYATKWKTLLHSLCSMSEGYKTKKGLRKVFNGAKNLKHFLTNYMDKQKNEKFCYKVKVQYEKKTSFFRKSSLKGKKKLKTLPIYLPQAAQEK